MISGKNNEEIVVGKALQTMAQYMADVAMNPTISIDQRMTTLQWIYKKIPEVNKLLIKIKTREVNDVR
jgi:hypothetical protein